MAFRVDSITSLPRKKESLPQGRSSEKYADESGASLPSTTRLEGSPGAQRITDRPEALLASSGTSQNLSALFLLHLEPPPLIRPSGAAREEHQDRVVWSRCYSTSRRGLEDKDLP